jgi:hypothetical protein
MLCTALIYVTLPFPLRLGSFSLSVGRGRVSRPRNYLPTNRLAFGRMYNRLLAMDTLEPSKTPFYHAGLENPTDYTSLTLAILRTAFLACSSGSISQRSSSG